MRIVSINGVPADRVSSSPALHTFSGAIDIIVAVASPHGAGTISLTVAVGPDTATHTRTISAGSAESLLSFTLNTAVFNPTTGVPQLHNGGGTLVVTALLDDARPHTSDKIKFQLENPDGVIITSSFAGFTNAEGVTTLTRALDSSGGEWRGGSVTIAALPVLYSGRRVVGGATPGSLTVTLPGALEGAQTVTPTTEGPVSVTYSATASAGPRVTGLKLVGNGFEADGSTPRGVTPTVTAVDNSGKELELAVLYSPEFRLDNSRPEAGGYELTAKGYADSWLDSGHQFGMGYRPAVSGSQNPVATLTFYTAPAARAELAESPGFSGWTKVTSANDLAETISNSAYMLKMVETDRLGNATATLIGGQKPTVFGVDKSRQHLAQRGAAPELSSVAVALVDGRFRVVSLGTDGRYEFLDDTRHSHRIHYVDAATLQLSEAVEELEALINSPGTRERDLQDFFERRPDFILTEKHARAHPHVTPENDSGKKLIPDFVLEPVNQSELCDVLDLKLPSVPTYVAAPHGYRLSAVVMDAVRQLRAYRDYFEDAARRQTIFDRYGLRAFRPNLFVVIGRRRDVPANERRIAEEDVPGIRVLTYDDVIDRVKARMSRKTL